MKGCGCFVFVIIGVYLTNIKSTESIPREVLDSIKFGRSREYAYSKTCLRNKGRKLSRSIELESAFIRKREALRHLLETTGQTREELQLDEVRSAAFVHSFCQKPKCAKCTRTRYRTMDGSCNNLEHPTWGQAFTAQRRFIPPVYGPDDSPKNSSLPSARQISNIFFKATESVPNEEYTGLIMAWGQLIDHDFTFTPTSGDFDCCAAENTDNPACFPIPVPDDDEKFSSCLNFVRSAATSAEDDCFSDTRQQINERTAYIDGSMVYGSSNEELADLRDPYEPHLLRTKEPGHLLPPTSPNINCVLQNAEDYCQLAGDFRVNVVPTMGVLQTLLLREHNRIATHLRECNSHWSYEKVFQETRKILGAIIQHITYNQWLPPVVGEVAMEEYHLLSAPTGHVDVYNSSVDPSVRNAFAGAALRYGHTLIMPNQSYLCNDYITQEDFSLKTQLLNPNMVIQKKGKRMKDIVRWAAFRPSQASDRMFEDGVRNELFGGTSDLPARSTQRGRDHGLPSYNAFRQFCGLSEVKHFGTGYEGLVNHTQENAELLESLYSSVDDIELYVAGVSEMLVEEGEVGPTFSCLIAKQFQAFKRGDAFWYENPGITGFSTEQLDAIKKVNLSGLLCAHFGLDKIQRDPFEIEVPGQCPGSTDEHDNCMVCCSEFELLNLKPWEHRIRKSRLHNKKSKGKSHRPAQPWDIYLNLAVRG